MSIFLNNVGANNVSAKQIWSDPVLFLAFGFGSGLAKKAPGTFGTLAGIPVYWVLSPAPFWLYSLLTVLVTVAGIWICQVASEKLGEHDFGGIVWDEIAGLLITLWFVPPSWLALFWGFVLFRVFDIVKPWPISWLDRHVHGGLGIMLDDVAAGVFAGVLLALMAVQGWLA